MTQKLKSKPQGETIHSMEGDTNTDKRIVIPRLLIILIAGTLQIISHMQVAIL